ncbi:hypothetical protein LINPERHAP1_LOCUS66 [Linum perenne]
MRSSPSMFVILWPPPRSSTRTGMPPMSARCMSSSSS